MNQKLLLPVIGGALLCAVAFQFFSHTDDVASPVPTPDSPVAQSIDEVRLPQPVTQTAPVRLPAKDDERPAPPSAPSYDDRLLAAGWGDLNSELFNTSYRVLRGYVEQYFAGSFQDREFIGNVAWQLTMRTSVTMNGKKKTVDLPGYINTSKYAVLSASLLHDSAPIRHLVTSQMQFVGEEESALALAEWAVDRFDDSSTPALYEFIETRYRAVARQGRDLDKNSVAQARQMFDSYVRTIKPPKAVFEPGEDHG